MSLIANVDLEEKILDFLNEKLGSLMSKILSQSEDISKNDISIVDFKILDNEESDFSAYAYCRKAPGSLFHLYSQNEKNRLFLSVSRFHMDRRIFTDLYDSKNLYKNTNIKEG